MNFKNWKHWKTSLLGSIIIVAAIVSVFINTNWTDAIVGISAGLMLIFAPDTILDKIKTLIKILFVMFVLQSCMTNKKLAQKCADKFPIKDSTVIVERIDTTYVTIKGDTIRVPFKSGDSIVYKLVQCPPKKLAQVVKYKEKLVYRENTAKVTILNILNDSLKVQNALHKEKIAELQEKKDKAVERNWYLLGIIGLFVAYKLVSWRFL
jgi:ribosomal protein L14E/L6E/L27E